MPGFPGRTVMSCFVRPRPDRRSSLRTSLSTVALSRSGRAIHASRFQNSSVFDSRESGRPDSSGRATTGSCWSLSRNPASARSITTTTSFYRRRSSSRRVRSGRRRRAKWGQALKNDHARRLTSTYSCLRLASLMDEQHRSPLLHRQAAVAVEQASTDSSREMDQPDT